MSDFLQRKEQLLGELNEYIAQCGQILDRLPEGYLDDLEAVKAWAETANADEWGEIEAWWKDVKPGESDD